MIGVFIAGAVTGIVSYWLGYLTCAFILGSRRGEQTYEENGGTNDENNE